jgi:2-polyprenyl-3-methyl-5-hydroxy-6-metoxy-1,4-benzoquinol methylase
MLSEQEIRPENLMAEQARLFALDIARLMENRADFIAVDCPACQQNRYAPAFEKTGMPFVYCQDCATLYANPRPQPVHLNDYYQNSQNYEYWSRHIFPASEDARREKIFKPRVAQVLDICERFQLPTNLLLEVGAGFGIFCEEMKNTGKFQTVLAVEPTPYLAEDCRRRGLSVIEKPIEAIHKTELTPNHQPVNVIACFEVIEHLFSTREFLLKCADLLDEGGLLIVTCPNGQGFDIVTLQEKSSAVDVEHLNLFNPESLAYLMEDCGFEIIDVQTPGQLDAELVRKQLLSGELNPEEHPFLKQLLIEQWETHGAAFQQFLVENRLSSNMMLAGRKKA